MNQDIIKLRLLIDELHFLAQQHDRDSLRQLILRYEIELEELEIMQSESELNAFECQSTEQ
jgi:hypothetical protein